MRHATFAASLAACGDTLGEQALIGAGATAALVTDGDATTGAAVGAAGNLLYRQANSGRC